MDESSGLEFLDVHPFVRPTVLDRVRGTIIGGALGDAVGLYTEFLSKDLVRDAYPEGKFQLVEPATELRNDGHRNKFVKTAWTDDTDHALLLLFSFVHTDGKFLRPTDFAKRLQFWCEQGLRCLDRLPLGLGRTVGSVVCDNKFLDDPIGTAYRHWRNSNCNAAPNGSLMRTHPLGIICLGLTLEETFQLAADFSRVTHADPRCIVSCCLSTALIRGMLRGEVTSEQDVDEMITRSALWVKTWMEEENHLKEGTMELPQLYSTFDHEEYDKHVHVESLDELELDDSMKMGYVYKTLGAGIFMLRCAMRRVNHLSLCEQPNALFEELITSLVLQGGDADTNATAAGALVGALLGYSQLPSKWKDGLMHGQWLLHKCNGLASVVRISPFIPPYKGSSDTDAALDGGKPPLNRQQLYDREHAFMMEYMTKTEMAARVKKNSSGWVDKWFRK
ncbi:ADP-ribosylglycohydrolase-domain-containing protein [Aspergillus bertholletiae]|uniref:ADP-ribosylglycohydrolase-domain-containing protein n=1 Tax=Aspergillus bertholletiae TaxID=1226010 RepID=A0A5N7B8V7_9EURO|nr:ADP-ribosylglycohydrolase-domain-containing protein [Aspergillus bertholletiae]